MLAGDGCHRSLSGSKCRQEQRSSGGFPSNLQVYTIRVLVPLEYFYPAVRSIGRDTKFAVAFSFIHLFIMYRYGFLSPGFNDCREIVNGGSVISQTGLLLFWGISPGMAEFFGVNMGHMAGYASC